MNCVFQSVHSQGVIQLLLFRELIALISWLQAQVVQAHQVAAAMQAQAVMQAQQMPPAPAPPIQKPRDIVLTEEKLQEKGKLLIIFELLSVL